MNIQKISFKGTYIFPSIKSRKTKCCTKKDFISTVLYLTDKTKKRVCVYKKSGLELKISDKYDNNMEKIADFYGIRFIRKLT